jgi:hypothetical protein
MLRGVKHLRRDAVAVRHWIRSHRAPAAAIGPYVYALYHWCWIVARANHQRHPQGELITGLMNRLLIFDLHQHGFAGADIGNRVGEDVGPFLLGQGSLLSVLPGLLVNDAGLLSLLDIADNDAVADHHLEGIDRAAGRQRIDVSRLHPVWRRVTENLCDAGPDRRTGDGEVDIDSEPGRVGGAAIIALQEQGARARVTQSRKGRLRVIGGPHRFKTQE